MKNLLVGNGINIQFDRNHYTPQQIVLRILKNCDRADFPTHIIVDFPYLLKNYLGMLFLEAREAIVGNYGKYALGSAEKSSLDVFKQHYGERLPQLRITDIGFEDYYLIHDLVCHKTKTVNPEQFTTREALRIAYLFSIFNDGAINTLHDQYPVQFICYLKSFDSIFTTNYDSNIELAIAQEVFHIHGQFDKKSDVYQAESLRNQLPDAPIKHTVIDEKFYYLYSNALTTYCGQYKEFQLKQYSQANSAIEKFAIAYEHDPKVRADVDSWTQESNSITANMGRAIQLKVDNPSLAFSDDYHFDRFAQMTGSLEILGLSPWNDLHIFECINNSNLSECTYYYYDENECSQVQLILSKLNEQGKIHFLPVISFWEEFNEK